MGVHVGPPKDLVDEGVDYLVIGSGFGGSVMAATLATEVGKEHSVCLLERGKAFPPGTFPRSWDGLNAAFWNPDSGRHGMFQMWSFRGIDAITASGLGGGSLIYANVMLEKPADWFTQPIPGDEERTETWSFSHGDLARHYESVSEILKYETIPLEVSAPGSPKTQRFLDASPGTKLAPLAVRFRGVDGPAIDVPLPDDGYPNIHGPVKRTTCQMRGECDVGCNAGAKSSMDHTYLSIADHEGATICIRSEVREIRRRADGSGYLFDVGYIVHPEESPGKGPSEDPQLQWIKAKRVVLAAGTLNSTQLMLRNRSHLQILESEPLGERFCGNGDLLGFAAPPLGSEGLTPSAGPVITTYWQSDRKHRILLQDGGLPNLRTWEQLSLREAAQLILRLGTEWFRRMFPPRRGFRPVSGPPFRWTPQWPLPLLGMGADTPDGLLTWNATRERMECSWMINSSKSYFHEVLQRMSSLSELLGTNFLINPQWNLDRVITVHPLGGCPADTTARKGVVDSFGRVHSVPGLWVTDGSVMPGPVGANPSLTIAAFAHRAAEKLLKEGLGTPSAPDPFIPRD